jgi:hypothetical protein
VIVDWGDVTLAQSIIGFISSMLVWGINLNYVMFGSPWNFGIHLSIYFPLIWATFSAVLCEMTFNSDLSL